MTTSHEPPLDDPGSQAEATIDELARRSAAAVRRPATASGIDAIRTEGARRRRRRTIAASVSVAVLAVGVFAIAQGGDDDDVKTVTEPGPTTPAPSPVTTAAPTTAAPTTAAPTTAAPTTVPPDPALEWALEATGGPGGVATGEPIRIGLGGLDGTISRATAELVNTELGGVRGRPVELVECDWTDEAGAVACGQQFAADPALSLVIGSVDPVDYLDALGDVPRFGGFIGAEGSGITYGASFQSQIIAIGEVITRDRPDADKVAYLGLSGASGLLAARLPGVEVVNVFGDPFSSAALVADINAAGAADADVLVLVNPTTDCSALREAVAELGTDAMIVTDICTNREEGWYYVDVVLNPDAPDEVWGANHAVELMPRQGVELVTEADPLAFYAGEFADLINAVRILNELGDSPTRDEISQALVEFTGPAALGGPQDCSLQQAPMPLPLGCAKFVQVLRVEDGRFVSQEPVEIRP